MTRLAMGIDVGSVNVGYCMLDMTRRKPVWLDGGTVTPFEFCRDLVKTTHVYEMIAIERVRAVLFAVETLEGP